MAPRSDILRSFLSGALLYVLLQGHAIAAPRAAITDRNGVVLATTTAVDSIYADPAKIDDAGAVTAALAKLLPPGVEPQALQGKLAAHKRFVWVARHVDANTAQSVMKLSLPGIGLRTEYRRVYPQGALTSHVVGIADYDLQQGMSGAERLFDTRLESDPKPVALSIDVRAQSILRDALVAAMTAYDAKGAAGLVLDAHSGEILAFVSLPDFLPADRNTVAPNGYRNKLTDEVHEVGGLFEVFTTAIALDDRRVTPAMLLDVTRPMRLQSTVLRDDEPSTRPLSVADVFARSSVIGAALITQRYSAQQQMASLRRLGLFDPMPLDGQAIVVSTMHHANDLRAGDRTAIGYGYGIALAPLQAAVVATAIANHGLLTAPTLLRRENPQAAAGMRIVSEQTSTEMRTLLRRVVSEGTGKLADVPGYEVGGKTGTAFKAIAGRYDKQRRTTWFFAGFPMNEAPRYSVLTMLDEPRGTAASGGEASSRWNAAPTAARVIRELAPLLGAQSTGGASHPL